MPPQCPFFVYQTVSSADSVSFITYDIYWARQSQHPWRWDHSQGTLTIGLSKDVLDGLVDCLASVYIAAICVLLSILALTAVDTVGLLVGDLQAEFL